MSEQAKARQEACCNASETEYFGARSQIDTLMQRHSFCAGFYRGYAAALVAAPAQERIDALELEVRQLTEQIAELRHAPTPQADSQPAPVREGEWINDAGRIKWLMWRVQDLEAKLAARAPADSVLEDAARYQWIRGPGEESTRYSRWSIEYWDGPNGWQPMQRERMDSAIDAARKQGDA